MPASAVPAKDEPKAEAAKPAAAEAKPGPAAPPPGALSGEKAPKAPEAAHPKAATETKGSSASEPVRAPAVDLKPLTVVDSDPVIVSAKVDEAPRAHDSAAVTARVPKPLDFGLAFGTDSDPPKARETPPLPGGVADAVSSFSASESPSLTRHTTLRSQVATLPPAPIRSPEEIAAQEREAASISAAARTIGRGSLKPSEAVTDAKPLVPPPRVERPLATSRANPRPGPNGPWDARTIEHLVDGGQWPELFEMLVEGEKAKALPPLYALIFALAYSETRADDAGAAIDVAIRATAKMHELPDTSPIARVIAKRLLRRNSPNWRKRSAPKSISLFLVVLAVVLGGGGGFWLSTTKVRIPIPGLTHHP